MEKAKKGVAALDYVAVVATQDCINTAFLK